MKELMILVSLIFIQLSLWAQSTNSKPLVLGIVESIESKALDEERVLNIYLPQGYHKDSATTYPVVYVLDGSAHEDFLHIAGLVQFLNMYEILPKSIVVGVANVDRYRDFTHTTTVKRDLKDIPQAGGSEKFMTFIEKELRPFITENYKTNGFNTIIGQSLGGLVATEILMKKTDLFDDYIIVSPSLWWDKQSLVDSAADFFKSNPDLKKRIVVSLGKEHRVMHKVAGKLAKAIEESGNDNITFHYKELLKEDHGTILHRAVYMAFEFLYEKEK